MKDYSPRLDQAGALQLLIPMKELKMKRTKEPKKPFCAEEDKQSCRTRCGAYDRVQFFAGQRQGVQTVRFAGIGESLGKIFYRPKLG